VTVTLTGFHFALIATLIIVSAAIFWPVSKPSGGMFDFGPSFEAAIHLIVGIIAALVVWLLYFALRC
jgi:hypothetical protein